MLAGSGHVNRFVGEAAAGVPAPDSMAALEQQALEARGQQQQVEAAGRGTTLAGFVSAGVIQQGKDGEGGGGAAAPAAAAGGAGANPEDIDLGEDDEDAGDDGGGGAGAGGFEPAQKAVPAAVFGGLGKRGAAGGPGGGDPPKRARQ